MRHLLTKVLFLFSFHCTLSETVQSQTLDASRSNDNSRILFSPSASQSGTDLSIQLVCKKKSSLDAVSLSIADLEKRNIAIRTISDQRGIAEFKYPGKIIGTTKLKIQVMDWSKIIVATEEPMKIDLPEKVCLQLRHQKKGVTPKR